MLDLNETYGIFVKDMIFILIVVLINFIILTIINKLLKEDIIKNEEKKIIFLFITIFFILSVILISREFAGLYNGFKDLMLIAITIFIGIFNTLIYLKKTHLTNDQYEKARIFLFIIWIFLCIPTIVVIEGAFPPEDEFRNWDSVNDVFEFNATNYNLNIQVDTQAIALKGFFAKTPILIMVYDGYVKDNEHNISINDTITIDVSLSNHPYYSENGTMKSFIKSYEFEYDTNNKFIIKDKDLKETWLLSYSYSGEKNLIIQTSINGDPVSTILKPIVTIEKGYIKAQVDMSRAIIILAIWTIFASLYKPIDKIVNWWIH